MAKVIHIWEYNPTAFPTNCTRIDSVSVLKMVQDDTAMHVPVVTHLLEMILKSEMCWFVSRERELAHEEAIR